MEGEGETDRRNDGVVEPNDDLRLCEVGGGFMGNANELGVPGAEGIGDPMAAATLSLTNWPLEPKSGGAGLLDDIRREGRSIFVTLP